MKNRVTYLDLAKGVGIILVVLGHMENINAGLRTFISSFHMPLFFVISGMLIALKREDELISSAGPVNVKGCKNIINKKFRGIIIPYLWFSLIYVPIDIMNLFIGNVDKHTFIQNLLDSATFSGISVMWFLPALFIAEVTALYVIGSLKAFGDKHGNGDERGENKPGGLILTAAAGIVISVVSISLWGLIKPLYNSCAGSYVTGTLLGIIRVVLRGMAMSAHVIIGFVMYKVIAGIKLLENRGIDMAAGVILLSLNLSLFMKNGDVDNHFLLVSNMPLYYLCAFFGSMAVILICKGFDSIKPIDFLGKNSLIIMATHLQCYILYAGILIAIAIDVYVTRAKSYVYMFNSVLFTMLIETAVIFVINRFFPFITGKGSIKDLKIFKSSK